MLRRFASPLAAIVVLFSLSAQAATESATDFIRTMGDRAVATVNAQDLSAAARAKRFDSIFRQAFAVPVIGRFVLGRYWRVATEAQRKAYLSTFADYVVKTYSERFSGAAGVSFTVGQATRLDDGEELVPSRIVRPGGQQPVNVQWRVKRFPTGYKIVDVIVDGVSQLITQRDEFASVINQHGGKVAGLIAALKQKTGQG